MAFKILTRTNIRITCSLFRSFPDINPRNFLCSRIRTRIMLRNGATPSIDITNCELNTPTTSIFLLLFHLKSKFAYITISPIWLELDHITNLRFQTTQIACDLVELKVDILPVVIGQKLSLKLFFHFLPSNNFPSSLSFPLPLKIFPP
ncbi:hypothetical protein CICLE_v10018088mg [Citrus x clementina]|uniref:Uncharacterized protein n=1 Tax=Citrus clementina TaxID=85681 RepID=V4UF20_CITCL|nr:hypothetical protein CICLE_v10018088mg [Citrus x clementina]